MMQSWRLYALGAVLGGFVAGALGWYFDAPQIKVVIAKFWAYADVNYRARRTRARRLHHLSASSTNTA